MSEAGLQSGPNIPIGTVTFLFTDIQGSTKMWERHTAGMHPALARHDAILSDAIQTHNGYIFKTVGDAFYAAFDTAPDALKAAIKSQYTLSEETWGETGPLRVRMAIHTGMVEARKGDYFGPPLNRVARLLSTGHGGQVLLSQVAYELIHDYLPEKTGLRDLGEHRLKDLTRPERIYQLLLQNLPDEFPPLRTLDSRPNNLPSNFNSFVGREKEIKEIIQLLENKRLITLTGPGGTGKTRLSLQVAADMLENFSDGVWLIELASVANPDDVPHLISSELGIREEQNYPLESFLTYHLRSKSLLLILDNCEHLINGIAHLSHKLLQSCPQLKILASSREMMRIAGETVYHVPPLSIPSPDYRTSSEELTQCEAVRLFTERAMMVKSGFTVTKQNAPAIAEVCYRLDGVPLAIELAAVRVRVISPEEIAARLDGHFEFLSTGSRIAKPRQQSVGVSVDWSWGLLAENEKVILRRLSVFAGRWTLEAAEAICSELSTGKASGVPKNLSNDMLDLLTQLVDKSLVTVVFTQSGKTRFRLLEIIRQFAWQKLLEAGEEKIIRDRHLQFYLHRAEEVDAKVYGAEQAKWLELLEAEKCNFTAAMEWAFQGDVDSEGMGIRLAGALGWFWYIRGFWTEGRKWLGVALQFSMVNERNSDNFLSLKRARGKVLPSAAHLAYVQEDIRQAEVLSEEGVHLNRELNDRENLAMSLLIQGLVARNRKAYRRAAGLHKQTLEIYKALEHKWGMAAALTGLGILARIQGKFKQSKLFIEQAFKLRRDLKDDAGIAELLHHQGVVEWFLGEQELALFHLKESLKKFHELGHLRGIAYSIRRLGVCAGFQGKPDRAAILMGADERLRKDLGASLPEVFRADYDQALASVIKQLGQKAFDHAWTEGYGMTMEKAVNYALENEAP